MKSKNQKTKYKKDKKETKKAKHLFDNIKETAKASEDAEKTKHGEKTETKLVKDPNTKVTSSVKK